jgi:hypothetical protein
MVQMASDDRVLEVDLRRRSVRTLLRSDHILGLGAYSRPTAPPAKANDDDEMRPWRTFLVVRTADRIIVTDLAGQAQRSYPLPDGLSSKWLTFWEVSDGTALIDRSRRTPEGNRHELLWIDVAGSVVRRREVVLESGATVGPAGAGWLAALAAPAPIAAAFAVPLAAGESELVRDDESAFLPAYKRGFADAWPALLAVVVAGAAMAWFCFRRQRRYAQPWTAAWVIFVFLGGIPGLIGYLLHRRWPVLETCPACGVAAPRDREHCARCRTEFPVPAAKGTEIFAA